MTEKDTTLKELKTILKVLILANADAIEKELSKIATTNERKKIWVLIDGKRMPKDIANEAGVTQMAVSYFLNAGVAAELIEYIKGEPPRRILNYVPPVWIDLVKLPPIEDAEKKEKVAKPQPADKPMTNKSKEAPSSTTPEKPPEGDYKK